MGVPGVDGMTVEEALPWLKEHKFKNRDINLCLDIRVLDENGNEIELKDDDDDDDVVYSSDTENEVVVGSTDEVLDAGFVIDEDSPESILDVFGDTEESDTDSYED